MNQPHRRIILAITGASGAILGIRALELLKQSGVETHLVISRAARQTVASETEWKIPDVIALADFHYEPEDTGARIASGSFVTDGMLVVPCSVKTLSGIANSYSDNLIVRATDVCLKEGRPLLLAVRETPLHSGHLRLMQLAAEAGAVIFPPIPAFYARPASMEEMVTHLSGRMLLRLGIENKAYQRWDGESISSPDQE